MEDDDTSKSPADLEPVHPGASSKVWQRLGLFGAFLIAVKLLTYEDPYSQTGLASFAAKTTKRCPIRVDDISELIHVASSTASLTYTYRVAAGPGLAFDANAVKAYGASVRLLACVDSETRKYLDHAITLHEVLVDPTGAEIANVEVNAAHCKAN